MTEETQGPNFLKRWSTRKREAANSSTIEDWPDKDAPVQTPFPNIDVESQPLAPNEEVLSDEVSEAVDLSEGVDVEAEPLLTDADMPPIESLTAKSDVSAFFNKGVSAALRKAALRYVFQQPEFNVRDGLNDYDGDYTVFEPLGDTITSDMKFHAARKERERLEAEAEAEAKRVEEELKAQQEGVQQESADDLESEEQEPLASDEDSSTDDAQSESEEEPSQLNDEADGQEPALQIAEKDDELSATKLFTTSTKDVTESV